MKAPEAWGVWEWKALTVLDAGGESRRARVEWWDKMIGELGAGCQFPVPRHPRAIHFPMRARRPSFHRSPSRPRWKKTVLLAQTFSMHCHRPLQDCPRLNTAQSETRLHFRPIGRPLSTMVPIVFRAPPFRQNHSSIVGGDISGRHAPMNPRSASSPVPLH